MIGQQFFLGFLQGVAEWLPVSSEGLIVLAQTHLFHSQHSLEQKIQEALFLHLGTVLSAIVYFRRDILHLCCILPKLPLASEGERKTVLFLAGTTLISALVGLALLKNLSLFGDYLTASAKGITVLVGLSLLMTAGLTLSSPQSGNRREKDITGTDILISGLAQGFAALPGLSRSGLTVSALLLKRFDKSTALRLSFLMSIPLVLGGNVILNLSAARLSAAALTGMASAFLFGLATIHILLKIAEKINFGYFVGAFGLLVLACAFL